MTPGFGWGAAMIEYEVFSEELGWVIAREVSTLAGSAGCRERDVMEGIIHAWRCYQAGSTPERAVQQGYLHADTLRRGRRHPHPEVFPE